MKAWFIQRPPQNAPEYVSIDVCEFKIYLNEQLAKEHMQLNDKLWSADMNLEFRAKLRIEKEPATDVPKTEANTKQRTP